jgi:hypothetical protein
MNELIERLHENGLKPGGMWFLEQAMEGLFTAILFEPKGDLITKAATILGRHDKEERWVLPIDAVGKLAQTDHVAQRWFSELPHERHVKILVLLHQGSTLLVNWQQGYGWYIEPGSLDADVTQ